jgi:hypothetical protein
VCRLLGQETAGVPREGPETWVARLKGLGHPPEVAALADCVASHGWAEVYSGPKGRGLLAARDVPAGALVALIVGRHVDRDDGLTCDEYRYYAARIVGDLDCISPEVNGSLANDAMGEEEYSLLHRGLRGFAQAYYRRAGEGTAELRWLSPGLAALLAARPLSAGEAIEYSYGYSYWAQLVAAGALGVSWETAWAACREVTRGDPARDDTVLGFFGLGALPPGRRESALADLGLSPRLPFYFGSLGVRAFFAGVAPRGGAVFLTPPSAGLTPEERRAPFGMAGESLRRVAEYLAGACPPAPEGVRGASLELALRELLEAARGACARGTTGEGSGSAT